MRALTGGLVLGEGFHVDSEGGPIIFNRFFEIHQGLTGAASVAMPGSPPIGETSI